METVRLAVFAMGCRFELLLAGGSPPSLRAAGEAAIEEIEEAHRRLSAFDPHSVISRINAGAGRHAERVDREVLELLTLCEEIRLQSRGAFDITVGRVMESQGYRRSAGGAAVCDARVGGLMIDREASLVGLSDAGAAIDLGGVGKGFGLDLAIRVLRESGVASAFIHAGTSSVAAIGRRPDGEAWRVTLPSGDGGGTTIDLADGALSVSGTGVQGNHVMDPRDGAPARNAHPVAVIGPVAAACDAWTTASFVLGARPPALPGAYRCMIETETGWADAPATDTGKTER